MKWVTRARPKTDRIACPWLIRRFIDPQAQIRYVPADQVLAVGEIEAARSFDAPGAEFTHRDNQCTFEVLIDSFGLGGDPALARLARIVHAPTSQGSWTGTHSAPGCWPSARAAWPWKPTTSGCWSAACSSTTPSTPGASTRAATSADD
jgi:hypothetical protein